MAYTKQTWACGDEITADKLNYMEEGIENAGGGCDCGFSCDEGVTTILDGNIVTTQPSGYSYAYKIIPYSGFTDADEIVVTFNGTTYRCEKKQFVGSSYSYYGGFDENGDPDFSEYPFGIESGYNYESIQINTQSAGTNQFKIEANIATTETTSCFEKAVNSVSGYYMIIGDTDGGNGNILRPYSEAYEAFKNGRVVLFTTSPFDAQIYHLQSITDSTAIFARSYWEDNEGMTEMYTDFVEVGGDGSYYVSSVTWSAN